MAVLWRVVAVALAVASCVGQEVPISFDEDLNRPLHRNDPCVERSHKRPHRGVCLPLEECPPAMEAYTGVGEPVFTTCGFKGVTRIVCCVQAVPKRVTSNGTATVSLDSVDISPPDTGFECGQRPPIPADIVEAFNSFVRENSGHTPGSGQAAAIGGKISYPNSWPWTALLGWSRPGGSTWWRCGGALINRRWVVTAAHCFEKGDPDVVRLGEHDYSNPDGPLRQDFKIRRYLLHPEYSIAAAYHDLALVELDRPVELKPSVAPVCLPWGTESLASLRGRNVILTGWGATQHGGELSPVIQEVTLGVFNPTTCDTNYRELPGFELEFPHGITERDFVCAGHYAGGKDACSGDSGSPITYYSLDQDYVLGGVVSKGYGCGLVDFPGLYTPLHRGDYLSWIKTTAFT